LKGLKKDHIILLMKSQIEIQKLDWDSNFFELPMYRVDINDKIEIEEISHKLSTLKGFYYIFSPFSINGLENLLVDEKIYFEQKVRQLKFNSCNQSDSKVRDVKFSDLTSTQLQSMKLLSRQAGKFSRFKSDKLLNSKFNALYDLWIEKSLSREIAESVLTIFQEEEILGLVSLVSKKENLEIGLISIDKKHQGKGLGKKLIDATNEFAFEKKLNNILVPTQRQNIQACSFYKKAGFKELNSTFIYHYNNCK
jgi:dTDP-4-amino-4,6-dideoxy-D-galactose acyltransferase